MAAVEFFIYYNALGHFTNNTQVDYYPAQRKRLKHECIF